MLCRSNSWRQIKSFEYQYNITVYFDTIAQITPLIIYNSQDHPQNHFYSIWMSELCPSNNFTHVEHVCTTLREIYTVGGFDWKLADNVPTHLVLRIMQAERGFFF